MNLDSWVTAKTSGEEGAFDCETRGGVGLKPAVAGRPVDAQLL